MNKTKTEEREHWIELLKGNRAYALTDDAKRSLGALAAAWHEAGNSFACAENGKEKFGKFLQNEVGPLVSGLFQENASDPPTLPKPWVDPVTNEMLPNPWLTNDAKGKLLLGKRDKALAEHFLAMAKSPYEYVARLQDNAAAALSSIMASNSSSCSPQCFSIRSHRSLSARKMRSCTRPSRCPSPVSSSLTSPTTT